jgi:hypothetical protein
MKQLRYLTLRPALQRLPLLLQSQELLKINETLILISFYGYNTSIRTDALKGISVEKGARHAVE